MLTAVRYAVWLVARLAFAVRYRVAVLGARDVPRGAGPLLFLPNHPAFADPPLVILSLWPRFRVRPVVLETNFQNPVLGPLGRLLRVIRVPDLSSASAEAKSRAVGALAEAVAVLKGGENVIVWPSGHLSRDGAEHLGGARAVSDLLAAVPHTTVVLIRTRGLWGSRFSWASGEAPNMMSGTLRGVGWALLGGLVLVPRRRVTLTLEAFPEASRPEPNREALNPWLEAWYNADVPAEPPTFVPYHRVLGPRSFEYPPPPPPEGVEMGRVKPPMRAAVSELLAQSLKRPLTESELAPERTFLELGLDSLEGMEISLELERRFGFTAPQVPTTVGQLYALASGQVRVAETPPAPAAWWRPHTGPDELVLLGETIGAAFLERVRRNPDDVVLADDLSGVLDYRRLLLGAMLLSRRFADLPGASVGLMLPASVAGMTSLLALHLAGKLPVILNWTTGPANMGYAVKLLGVSHVVTSRRFVDRAQIEVPGAEFACLEDVRETFGRFEKLVAFARTKYNLAGTVRGLLKKLNPDPSRPAVVLFTSGSEKAPKAVPLTHANVIADLRAAIPLLGLNRTHAGLVFLPLFHSFGHTVTGMLPVLGGVKAVLHPDPTDAGALVRKCAAYKASATAVTPTFLNYMLDKATAGDLATLDILVMGAEKAPQHLIDRVKVAAPHAHLMEGYGVTECGPVVAVNPYARPKLGTMGVPLVGFEVALVDPDTGADVPKGERGRLLVRGPNVFPGYLGTDDSPFVTRQGKRFYNTGDLAALDADGYLVFHGRLKRFLKAGGEMISLPALEEPLAEKFPPTDAGPQVAVEGIETPDGRQVVLFATRDVSLTEANGILQAAGLRGVMRLDEVRRVDTIPVLGTGKTDYKVLRGMLTA